MKLVPSVGRLSSPMVAPYHNPRVGGEYKKKRRKEGGWWGQARYIRLLNSEFQTTVVGGCPWGGGSRTTAAPDPPRDISRGPGHQQTRSHACTTDSKTAQPPAPKPPTTLRVHSPASRESHTSSSGEVRTPTDLLRLYKVRKRELGGKGRQKNSKKK